MKTEYRSIGDGYCRWLQYKKTIKFLFFRFSFWKKVLTPHWDEWDENGITGLDHEHYVNSYNTNLEEFVLKYPDIRSYFEEMNIQFNKNRNAVREKIAKRKHSNSGIKKL